MPVHPNEEQQLRPQQISVFLASLPRPALLVWFFNDPADYFSGEEEQREGVLRT